MCTDGSQTCLLIINKSAKNICFVMILRLGPLQYVVLGFYPLCPSLYKSLYKPRIHVKMVATIVYCKSKQILIGANSKW